MSETTIQLIVQLLTALVVLVNMLLGQNRGQAISRLHKAVDDLKNGNGNGDTQPITPPQ